MEIEDIAKSRFNRFKLILLIFILAVIGFSLISNVYAIKVTSCTGDKTWNISSGEADYGLAQVYNTILGLSDSYISAQTKPGNSSVLYPGHDVRMD